MKYVILVPDGMADEPQEKLGGKTPLEYARTPHMDFLARQGRVGLVRTIPEGMPPGSDVANLAIMGYDPRRYYTGRAPLEAASQGIPLSEGDVAFRCNLVTLSAHEPYGAKIMMDYSADEITTEEARILMAEVNRVLGRDGLRFHAGVSYRHLLIWKGGPADTELTPPHDIQGRPIADYLPRGGGSAVLRELMERSVGLLSSHPVNRAREARGLRPANSLWFWGQGLRPALPGFTARYGLKASVVAAVDLVRGIGRCARMQVPEVPGATGNLHTDYGAKARAALAELAGGRDLVYVHVEAPDEAGHRGELENKVRAIEEVDEKILGELLRELPFLGPHRVMVLADHPTPLRLRTHVSDPVPCLVFDSQTARQGAEAFHEGTAARAGWLVKEGHRLMELFLRG